MAGRKRILRSKYRGRVMSATAFLAAARAAGVRGRNRERARRILVEGETVQGLAKKDGLSTPYIYSFVREVYRHSSLSDNGDPNERYWPMLAPPPPKGKET